MELSREKALQFFNEKLKNDNLRKHSLASEAVLRALAKRLNKDEMLWGLTGLLHDIDLDVLGNNLEKHASLGADWLKEAGYPDELVHAVRAHNAEATGTARETELDFALGSGEQITGLIVANALVVPSKKLSDVKPESVKKRMKEKRFAAGVNREMIRECEKLGLTIDEFVEISIKAMQEISGELGF